MKNKGFTLIELLAVIVILAIIALIATPIILGIINDAREEAKQRSAELAYTGVEYAVTTYMYDHDGDTPTTVAAIQPSFKAENVYMTEAGLICENSVEASKCTTDEANKDNILAKVEAVTDANDNNNVYFKVTSKHFDKEKTIFASK